MLHWEQEASKNTPALFFREKVSTEQPGRSNISKNQKHRSQIISFDLENPHKYKTETLPSAFYDYESQS